MKIRRGDIRVARILDRDEDFATLEVARSEEQSFTLGPPGGKPDEFVFLLFVQVDDAGDMALLDPWTDEPIHVETGGDGEQLAA